MTLRSGRRCCRPTLGWLLGDLIETGSLRQPDDVVHKGNTSAPLDLPHHRVMGLGDINGEEGRQNRGSLGEAGCDIADLVVLTIHAHDGPSVVVWLVSPNSKAFAAAVSNDPTNTDHSCRRRFGAWEQPQPPLTIPPPLYNM